jgi:hypothetical protein
MSRGIVTFSTDNGKFIAENHCATHKNSNFDLFFLLRCDAALPAPAITWGVSRSLDGDRTLAR